MKKQLNNIGIVLFIATILFIGIIALRNTLVLNKNHKYTIGTVYNFEAEKGGYKVNYYYWVNTEKIHATSIVNEKHFEIIGKHFYVLFYPPNPKNSQILLDKPVQDTIIKAPANGWEKIPYSP